MANLITDEAGLPKPQYENAGGTAFEAMKGKDGHINVRSEDGEFISVGAKADAAVDDETAAAGIIGLLKGLVKTLKLKNPTGAHANAWNAVAVVVDGLSNAIDTAQNSNLTIMGNVSAATTLTVRYSQDNVNYYAGEQISATADFVLHVKAGARYVELASSAAATITATIAGKA